LYVAEMKVPVDSLLATNQQLRFLSSTEKTATIVEMYTTLILEATPLPGGHVVACRPESTALRASAIPTDVLKLTRPPSRAKTVLRAVKALVSADCPAGALGRLANGTGSWAAEPHVPTIARGSAVGGWCVNDRGTTMAATMTTTRPAMVRRR